MYDFLLLTPHAHASHSLVHYLNQHTALHVAPFSSIYRSLDDITAYERLMRAYIPVIGVATKTYNDLDIVNKILSASKRSTFVQVVRDPVECFVSRVRDEEHRSAFWSAIGKSPAIKTIEEQIAYAVTELVTPAFAAEAYQAD